MHLPSDRSLPALPNNGSLWIGRITTNAVSVKTANRVVSLCSHPRRALVAAGVLHLFVAVLLFGVGRLGIFKDQFDPDGIGHFALDSYSYQTEAIGLAGTLAHKGLIAWLTAPVDLHVKLYSLGFGLLGPLLGQTILASEPLNLIYYLLILILTFKLTKAVANQRTAIIASALVALWPSLLFHTTQLLRDPIFIVVVLSMILGLSKLLTQTYSWGRGACVGVIGGLAGVAVWLIRPEMWLAIRAIIYVAIVLFAIRMWRERKLLAGTLTGLLLLTAITTATIFMTPPQMAPFVGREPVNRSLWFRIAKRRHDFIVAGTGNSGSDIDVDVEFSNRADIIKYVPRATEIGYLAPFPEMWFTSGNNVGLIGRLLAAAETLVLYAIEILAVIGLWQGRRQLTVWLLALSGAICLPALGLVVVNVGTLYRMRYAFCILLVVLAASSLGSWARLDNSRLGNLGKHVCA